MSRKGRGELHFRLAGFLGALVLTLLGWTLRFRLEGAEHVRRLREEGRPIVFVFWHSRMIPLVHLHRHEGVVVLVSGHRDGEYIARAVGWRGFGLARGSSTRGGAEGLRELIRALRGGRDVAVTPDGPRGPERVFKPGALMAAQAVGALVVPVSVEGSRAWWLSSWDRFMIPKPFARILVRYGEPREVPRKADEETLAALAGELGREMSRDDGAPAGVSARTGSHEPGDEGADRRGEGSGGG